MVENRRVRMTTDIRFGYGKASLTHAKQCRRSPIDCVLFEVRIPCRVILEEAYDAESQFFV